MTSEAETRLTFIARCRELEPDGNLEPTIGGLHRAFREYRSATAENRHHLDNVWERLGGANPEAIAKLMNEAKNIGESLPSPELLREQIEWLKAAQGLPKLLASADRVETSPADKGIQIVLPKPPGAASLYENLQTTLQTLFGDNSFPARVKGSPGTGEQNLTLTVVPDSKEELTLFLTAVLQLPSREAYEIFNAIESGAQRSITVPLVTHGSAQSKARTAIETERWGGEQIRDR